MEETVILRMVPLSEVLENRRNRKRQGKAVLAAVVAELKTAGQGQCAELSSEFSRRTLATYLKELQKRGIGLGLGLASRALGDRKVLYLVPIEEDKLS